MRYKMLVFNTMSLAEALWITEAEVTDCFVDGRVIARFAEHWAGKLYGLDVANYNQKGFDASKNDTLMDTKVSVRVLGKGNIKFQQSKYIGSGRSCTKDDLVSSLKKIDVYIVVDVVNFPRIKIIPIKAMRLLDFVENNELSCNGWGREIFYETLSLTNVDWEIINVN